MLNRCVLDNFFQLQQISTNIGWGTPDLFQKQAISRSSASARAFRQYPLLWSQKNSDYNKLDNNNNSTLGNNNNIDTMHYNQHIYTHIPRVVLYFEGSQKKLLQQQL